jgi:trimethylamine:corrinoid methyltransferase-like protein
LKLNQIILTAGMNITSEYTSSVVDGAARLLEDFGIELKSRKLREFFASSFKGVTFKDDRICFSRGMVHDFIDELKERPHIPKYSHDTTLSHGESWNCLNLADVKTGQIRPASGEDLSRIVRFLDAYGVKGLVPPVSPSEYEAKHRDLHGTRICLENSPVYGAPTDTPDDKEAELYKEMSRVVDRKIWILGMLLLNPMRFDERVLEFVLKNRDVPEFDIQMVSGLPALGSTAPLVFPAIHIQGLAEDLASSLFMKAAMGYNEPPYLRGDPFDMRFMNFVISGPEYILADMANRAIYNHLTGEDRWWGYLMTMSKWPDQQAMYERSTCCVIQALNGATYFKGSGQMASDEVYSPEQVVFDRAIVRGVEHLVKGNRVTQDVDQALATIKEGVTEGHFLSHETTLEHFRDFFCDRGIFPATNLGQWRSHNEPIALEEASRVVEDMIRKNDFQRPKEEIRELRKICKIGEEIL